MAAIRLLRTTSEVRAYYKNPEDVGAGSTWLGFSMLGRQATSLRFAGNFSCTLQEPTPTVREPRHEPPNDTTMRPRNLAVRDKTTARLGHAGPTAPSSDPQLLVYSDVSYRAR